MPQLGEPYRPLIALPEQIKEKNPGFSTCIGVYFSGLDPPRSLIPATAMGSTTTSRVPQMTIAKAMPSSSLHAGARNTATDQASMSAPSQTLAVEYPKETNSLILGFKQTVPDPQSQLYSSVLLAPQVDASTQPRLGPQEMSSDFRQESSISDNSAPKSNQNSPTLSIPSIASVHAIVSSDPAPRSTPIQRSDPSNGVPTVTGPELNLPFAHLPATALATDDRPNDPSPSKQDQKPDTPHIVGANDPNTLQTAADPVLTVDPATFQHHAGPSNLVFASQIAQAGGPAISMAGVQIGLPIEQDQNPNTPQIAGADDPNTSEPAVDPVPTVDAATYKTHANPSSSLVFASQTAQAAGPAMFGAGVQIGPSPNLVFVSQTAPAGGPAISMAGVQIGLPIKPNQNPDTAQIAGADDPNTSGPAVDPVPTVDAATYKTHANPSSSLVFASQTAQAAGPAMFGAGFQIGPLSSANNVVVGGDHVPIAASALVATTIPQVSGSSVLEHNEFTLPISSSRTPESQISSIATIAAANPVTDVFDTPSPLRPSSTTVDGTLANPAPDSVIANGNTIVRNPNGGVVVGSSTVMPGSTAQVAGAPLSVGTDHVVLGSSSYTLPVASTATRTELPITPKPGAPEPSERTNSSQALKTGIYGTGDRSTLESPTGTVRSSSTGIQTLKGGARSLKSCVIWRKAGLTGLLTGILFWFC